MSFITSLISISSLATWIFLPLNAIFLTLDGIVYSLVAYSYKIFMLIAQLNYNVLYAWMAPLIDRVKAIILVLIMFKVGYALIQYMINPDKLDDSKAGGPALLKNIAISAVLLISYTFIFSFMNELTLLFIGVPEGYEFTTLKEVAEVANDGKDSGLIARFIFGKEADNVGEFGKQLSVNTLSIFLHSKAGQTSDLDNIYQELANGDMNAFDAMKIVTIVARIDKDVEYKWPLVSTAAGLYLTWQIIKLAIELAIRMFKLLVLQVLAPFAIVSIVDGGMNNGTWSKYVKTFIGIWTDAFIRVGSLFLATALVGQFYNEFDALVPDAANGTITRGLILLIVLFSAYKCTELIPKLIKEVFPGMGSGGDNAKGFGGLLGGLAGAGMGAVSGFTSGAIGGAGMAGILGNTIRGGITGVQSGSKGKNVMDFFNNQAKVSQGNRDMAQKIARQGGGLAFAGAAIENRLGIPQAKEMMAQRQKDNSAALENMMKARGDALVKMGEGVENGEVLDAEGHTIGKASFKYGNTKEATVANMRNSAEYKVLENQYSEAIKNNDVASANEYASQMKSYESYAESSFDSAALNTDFGKDARVAETTRVYDTRHGTLVGNTARKVLKRDNASGHLSDNGGKKSLEARREAYETKTSNLENSRSAQRANRQDNFGGK